MKSLDRINMIHGRRAIHYDVEGLGGTGLAHEAEKQVAETNDRLGGTGDSSLQRVRRW